MGHDTVTYSRLGARYHGLESVWALEHSNILLSHKMPSPRGAIGPDGNRRSLNGRYWYWPRWLFDGCRLLRLRSYRRVAWRLRFSWLPSHAGLHSCLRLYINTSAPVRLRLWLAPGMCGNRFQSVLTTRLDGAANDRSGPKKKRRRRPSTRHRF